MLRRLLLITFTLLTISLSHARAQDDMTLRIQFTTSPSDPTNLRAVLESFRDEFLAENPDVTLEYEFVDTADARQRLIDGVEDGTAPDIATIGARWVPEFVSLSMIEPLDRYLTPEFRARFVPSILNEGAVYQGRTFGLPIATSTRALYYNRDLFARAGIDAPPETWDELLQAAQAISALPGENYGFGLQGGGGIETNTYFYYFVWGNGGDLYNAPRTESLLDAPEAVEALEFIQTMIDSGATQPNPTDAAYERRRGVETLFGQGNLGMVISGPWFINLLRTLAPDLNFGVAPIPYNTTPATYGVMDAISILRTSRNKDLAWRFLEFMFADERRLAYTSTVGVLPELISVAEDPIFADDADFAVFLSLLPDARFEPLHIQSEQISFIVIDAIRTVYLGEAQPRDALADAADEIDDLLVLTAASR
jgi:multiple sugar transport system substrate-binding protein